MRAKAQANPLQSAFARADSRLAAASLHGALLRALCGSVASLSMATSALADYPDRPIRIVVSAASGGYLDVIARAVAKELQTQWGQPVFIDNKAGASGVIGATTVQNSKPDGYTWLAGTESHLVTNKFTQKNLPYDFHRDFVGISVLAKAEQVIVATKEFPANTLPELVALARKTPGGLAYGSWGVGSHPHLLFSKLGSIINTEFVMVPYKGVAPTMNALQGGEVQLSVMSPGTAKPLLDSGRIKILAAASKERLAGLPDVPTTEELGFKGLRSTIYMVLLMPKATPPDIVYKASRAVQAIMKRPEFAASMVAGRGFQLMASDSRGVTEAMDELLPLVADSVKAARIVAE